MRRAEALRKWRTQFVELTPLEFMLRIMNRRSTSKARELRIARVALPFFHRKLRPVNPPPDLGPFPKLRDDMTSEEIHKTYRDSLQWFHDRAAREKAFHGSIDPADVWADAVADIRATKIKMNRIRARRPLRSDRLLSLIDAPDEPDDCLEDLISRAKRVNGRHKDKKA